MTSYITNRCSGQIGILGHIANNAEYCMFTLSCLMCVFIMFIFNDVLKCTLHHVQTFSNKDA